MNSRKSIVIFFLFILSFISITWAVDPNTVLHPAIEILDESGDHVLDSGKAYSSKQSCSGTDCHDYDRITHAYHFEMGRDEASDNFGKLRGLPQLVSPGYYGGYNCMGGDTPTFLAKKSNDSAALSEFRDYGSAGFIKRCTGCHVGGGSFEKDRTGRRYDGDKNGITITEFDGDYYNRGTATDNGDASMDEVTLWDWNKSGVVEADCLMCHLDTSNMIIADASLDAAVMGVAEADRQTPFELATRTRRTLAGGGDFRQVGTAMLEFMNLNITDSTADDRSLVQFHRGDITIDSRDRAEYEIDVSSDGSHLTWNSAAFDTTTDAGVGRAVKLPMLHFPGNDNCMTCHRMANRRSGFYGYVTGITDVSSDKKFDVHMGKSWEENGVTKEIKDCNSCHSNNYYREITAANTPLAPDHNIPKGNSHLDNRNDLDYNTSVKTCLYCHETNRPPSWASMFNLHNSDSVWKKDYTGYGVNTHASISQKHLDVISCETCHITNNKLSLYYRYKKEGDGKVRITPTSEGKDRFYWKDKTSGYVLTREFTFQVFGKVTDDSGNNAYFEDDPSSDYFKAGLKDAGGSVIEGGYGIKWRESHGSDRYYINDITAEGYRALKNALDSVLEDAGFTAPNTQHHVTEINNYIVSHNVTRAVDAITCDQCHESVDGSYLAAVSDNGILGKDKSYTSRTLPGGALISEGIVVLGEEYMKVDATGDITVNVADILRSTKKNPSLSALNAEAAKVMIVGRRKVDITTALSDSGISNTKIIAALKERMGLSDGDNVQYFNPNKGVDSISGLSAFAKERTDGGTSIFETLKIQMKLADSSADNSVRSAGKGTPVSAIYDFSAKDSAGADVSDFDSETLYMSIPITGSGFQQSDLQVITSSDGETWVALDRSKIFAFEASVDGKNGSTMFETTHFSYYTITSTAIAAVVTGSDEGVKNNGGGCFIGAAGNQNQTQSGAILLIPGLLVALSLVFRKFIARFGTR